MLRGLPQLLPQLHRPGTPARAITALALAAAAAAALPAASHAGTLTKFPGGMIVYNAIAGEDNDLTITQDGDLIVFEEASLPVTAFPSCWQAGLTRAECPAADVAQIAVDAGDGVNGVVASAPFPIAIDGMAGAANSFQAGPSGSQLIGGVNQDVLTGGAGHDEISGNDGSDEITGLGGADTLEGGVGADRFLSGTMDGADLIDGGPDSDTADYSARATRVSVSVDNVANDGGRSAGPIQVPENDNVRSSVELVRGGTGDDTIIGSGAANRLSGGPGDDRLGGLLGADRLDGGPGSDSVSYEGYGGPVTVDPDGEPGDDGLEGEFDTVGDDVERIVGGSGADRLTGNAADNEIRGGAGNDLLDGLAGSDQLFGEAGDDELRSDDGVVDGDDCGDGVDTTVADPLDARIACELPAPPMEAPPGETVPGATGPAGTEVPPGITGSAEPSPPPSLKIGPARLRLDRRGGATLRVGCPAAAVERCVGTLTITRAVRGFTRRVARRDFSIAAGRTAGVRLRVSRSVRRAVARGRVGVRVTALARDAVSAAGDSRARVTLTRPVPRG